jgi:hypothetical protein|eukprot:30918-Pelagococcus_subviridis.AAC.8
MESGPVPAAAAPVETVKPMQQPVGSFDDAITPNRCDFYPVRRPTERASSCFPPPSHRLKGYLLANSRPRRNSPRSVPTDSTRVPVVRCVARSLHRAKTMFRSNIRRRHCFASCARSERRRFSRELTAPLSFLFFSRRGGETSTSSLEPGAPVATPEPPRAENLNVLEPFKAIIAAFGVFLHETTARTPFPDRPKPQLECYVTKDAASRSFARSVSDAFPPTLRAIFPQETSLKPLKSPKRKFPPRWRRRKPRNRPRYASTPRPAP